jgi:hypothetical protein
MVIILLHNLITNFDGINPISIFPRSGKIDKIENSKYMSYFNALSNDNKCSILEDTHNLFVLLTQKYKQGVWDDVKPWDTIKKHYVDISANLQEFAHNIQYMCLFNAVLRHYKIKSKLDIEELLTQNPDNTTDFIKKVTLKTKMVQSKMLQIETMIADYNLSLPKIWGLLLKKQMSFSRFKTIYYTELKKQSKIDSKKTDPQNQNSFTEIEEKQAKLAQSIYLAEIATNIKDKRVVCAKKRKAVLERIIIADLYINKKGMSYRAVTKELYKGCVSYSLLKKMYRRYKDIKQSLTPEQIATADENDVLTIIKNKTNKLTDTEREQYNRDIKKSAKEQ